MYGNGTGVKKDYAKAKSYFEASAKSGHNWAMFNLGITYEYGYGVEVDHAEAVGWFQKAQEKVGGDTELAAKIKAELERMVKNGDLDRKKADSILGGKS